MESIQSITYFLKVLKQKVKALEDNLEFFIEELEDLRQRVIEIEESK